MLSFIDAEITEKMPRADVVSSSRERNIFSCDFSEW